MVIHKAAACVVRAGPRGPELLVFRHPSAGVQIPKGSVEPGERPDEAVLRELAEESGVTGVRVVAKIGRHEVEVGAGPTGTGPRELQVWHTFLLTADEELPDAWSHRVSGSEVEAGLVFDYFWLPLADARGVVAARYHASIDLAMRRLADDAPRAQSSSTRGRPRGSADHSARGRRMSDPGVTAPTLPLVLAGRVQSGQGDAARWLSRFNAAYGRKLGMAVFPGSLNVALGQRFDWHAPELQRHVVRFGREEYGGERDILLLPCRLRNLRDQQAFLWTTTTAARDREDPWVVEIVAPIGLRATCGLGDGDPVIIEVPADAPPAEAAGREAPTDRPPRGT